MEDVYLCIAERPYCYVIEDRVGRRLLFEPMNGLMPVGLSCISCILNSAGRCHSLIKVGLISEITRGESGQLEPRKYDI